MSEFNLWQFLIDVFDPQKDDNVLLLADLPTKEHPENLDWLKRRLMMTEWHAMMCELAKIRDFEVLPYVYYPATGVNSAPLPDEVVEMVKNATLVLAMTEWSATGPLGQIAKQCPNLRFASMPRLLRRMEQSALAADYKEVQRRCAILAEIMAKAVYCDVVFDDENFCIFDLRGSNHVGIDNGYLHQDARDRGINLPSGEVYKVPNEAEDSATVGHLPVSGSEELDKSSGKVIFRVVRNKIVSVDGIGPKTDHYRKYLTKDPARCNIAECAFGVNPLAIVTGNVLEDEKAGFHWALGQSSHLGGTVGPDKFKSPATVVHQDFIYAKGSPIQVQEAVLVDGNGIRTTIIRDSEYVIF